MNKEEYIDSFKNPKWQKKRLHILSRDNFTCQFCGEKENPLHVHHFYYKKDFKPWEYPDDAMVTLCERCHNREHLFEGDCDINYNKIKDFFKKKGFSMVYFCYIISRLEYSIVHLDINDKNLMDIFVDSLILKRDIELFEKLFSKE